MPSLFVIMLPSGLPARTAGPGGGNKPPSAKCYEHAGRARRVVRECHPRGKVLRATVKADAVTENDMCIGFCVLDADGNPIRIGREGSTCVRLYGHIGFARKAASSLLKNLEMESFGILAGRCWGAAAELDVIF